MTKIDACGFWLPLKDTEEKLPPACGECKECKNHMDNYIERWHP